jgi:cytosine deaminase
VDVHCDEIDDEQSRFIETLATLAYERGIGHRVTASHTTAMHSYNGAYASRLFRLLRMADINFVANPLVNIHLQGRFDSYPKRRGITRVKEMLEANINVCFGHDDVFDPGIPWARPTCCRCCTWGCMSARSWATNRSTTVSS